MKKLFFPIQENFNLAIFWFGLLTINFSIVGYLDKFNEPLIFEIKNIFLTFSYYLFFFGVVIYIINLIFVITLYD